MDGSFLIDMALAAYGGIARDYEGRFTGINIGKCSVIVAELWGVLWGFFMGQSLGCHNISLERDLLFVPPNFMDTPTLREKKNMGSTIFSLQSPLPSLLRICKGSNPFFPSLKYEFSKLMS